MNKIVLSRHAKERIRERGISNFQIKEAIAFPDKVSVSSRNKTRFIVRKLYWNVLLDRKHLLLIIYEERKNEIFVITIIDTSKIDKYF